MKIKRLYEPPFTDLASQGPKGIFKEGADELVEAIKAVRERAEPREEAA
jgi:hypothetical protein